MGNQSSTNDPKKEYQNYSRKSLILEQQKYFLDRNNNRSSSSFGRLISQVPVCIFPIIESYTSYEIIRNLVNTNKKFFHAIKREILYLRLNRFYSLKYWNNFDFRALVNARILNPERQIHLFLTGSGAVLHPEKRISLDISSSIKDLITVNFPFPKVHSVTIRKFPLNDYQCTIMFENCYELILDDLSDLINLNNLPKIENLKLLNLNKLESISSYTFLQEIYLIGCSKLIDVTPIAHVPNIHLYDCKLLSDISCFNGTKQKCIHLDKCNKIENISTLGSIHKVSIYHCDLIEDISVLSKVYDLSIMSCLRIADYSVLTDNVHLKLTTDAVRFQNSITGFPLLHTGKHFTFHGFPIENLSAFASTAISMRCINNFGLTTEKLLNCKFEQLTYFELRNCNSIKDIDCLGNISTLQTIILNSCIEIREVSTLGRIPIVKLDCLENLKNIIGLGNGNQFVKISYCPKIYEFQSLKTVPKVMIIGCNAFPSNTKYSIYPSSVINRISPIPFLPEDITPLQYETTKYLFLERLSNLIEVTSLQHLYFLKIAYCPKIITLNDSSCFMNIHTIFISHCEELQDISGLGNGNNQHIEIEFCPKISMISHLKDVPILIIQNCALLPTIYHQ